jgi:hypothetical protein
METLANGANVLFVETPGVIMESTGKSVQHVTKGIENITESGKHVTKAVSVATESAVNLLETAKNVTRITKDQFEKQAIKSEARVNTLTAKTNADVAQANEKSQETIQETKVNIEQNIADTQAKINAIQDPVVKKELQRAITLAEQAKTQSKTIEARRKLESDAGADERRQQKIRTIDNQYSATIKMNLKCQQIGFEKLFLTTLPKYRLLNYGQLSYIKSDFHCLYSLTPVNTSTPINVIAKYGIPETVSPEPNRPEPNSPETVSDETVNPEQDSPKPNRPENQIGGTNDSGKQWYYSFKYNNKEIFLTNEKLSEIFSTVVNTNNTINIDNIDFNKLTFTKCGSYKNPNIYEKMYSNITFGGKPTRKLKKRKRNRRTKKQKCKIGGKK